MQRHTTTFNFLVIMNSLIDTTLSLSLFVSVSVSLSLSLSVCLSVYLLLTPSLPPSLSFPLPLSSSPSLFLSLSLPLPLSLLFSSLSLQGLAVVDSQALPVASSKRESGHVCFSSPPVYLAFSLGTECCIIAVEVSSHRVLANGGFRE